VKNNTVSVIPSLALTTSSPPSTNILLKINQNSENTSITNEVEMVIPFVTSETITPSVQTNVRFHGFSTTSKPISNEVLVEMQKVNVATYVMAGLGLLPLVIILIYVVKQYLFRQENKDSDLENYDIQPISPVATLDQSDDASSIDGGESIISETDFNRSDLRFKSLLGEGNFGQVWKAEADNLAGHMGNTRIVAVKTERANNGQGGLKAECEIMRKLGSHSNVVTLLGACVEAGKSIN
jgi:Protein tyrosine and serine/threonine kinase